MIKKFDFVAAALAGFATTGLVMFSFPAHAQTAPVEVVRPGDRQMTCPALAAEINVLAQPQAAVATSAKPKKKGGLGFLRMLGSAVPMIGGVGGGIGGGVLSAAGSLAAEGQAEKQMDDAQSMAREAMAGPTAAQQRKERLIAIFEEKRC